jgi:hypothetical protein
VNIAWVIPCRFVEVHDNLATIVGGGIDTLWVPELPAPLQIVLCVRLTGTPEELTEDQQHKAVNRVRDPQGNVVSEISGEFAIGVESARPDWLVGISLPTAIQFEATEEGTYTIDHLVDDAEYSIPMHVAVGQP